MTCKCSLYLPCAIEIPAGSSHFVREALTIKINKVAFLRFANDELYPDRRFHLVIGYKNGLERRYVLDHRSFAVDLIDIASRHPIQVTCTDRIRKWCLPSN